MFAGWPCLRVRVKPLAKRDMLADHLRTLPQERFILPGKELLHVRQGQGSTVFLHTPTEVWSLDSCGRLVCVTKQDCVRKSVQGRLELLADGRVFLMESPFVLPVRVPAWSLHPCGDGRSVAMVCTDGSVDVSPCADSPYLADQTVGLTCTLAVHASGLAIVLTPDVGLSVHTRQSVISSFPFVCTPDTSMALLDDSDHVLVAVPGKALSLVRWMTGEVVASMPCDTGIPPRWVVAVGPHVWIVNDTWTIATVMLASDIASLAR